MSTGHQVLSFVTSDEIATSEITKGSEIATRFGMALGEITAAKDTCCVVEFVISFSLQTASGCYFPMAMSLKASPYRCDQLAI